MTLSGPIPGGPMRPGPYRVRITLTDDGTLDRVFDCVCRKCGLAWEERFVNDGEGFLTAGEQREMIEEAHAQESPDCY